MEWLWITRVVEARTDFKFIYNASRLTYQFNLSFLCFSVFRCRRFLETFLTFDFVAFFWVLTLLKRSRLFFEGTTITLLSFIFSVTYQFERLPIMFVKNGRARRSLI